MKTAQDIIVRPIITEDSMARIADKTYTFEVMKSATKPEIASAVEELFKVKVADVNTIIDCTFQGECRYSDTGYVKTACSGSRV